MLENLKADRARVTEIAAQIADLERSIVELRIEQAVAQERLDSYKYPVLTLPNELLSEIFVHFLPGYPFGPPLVGILSPTSLTQICRRWRAVALATPELWKAIFMLSKTDFPRGCPKSAVEIFEAWLSRSGACPLSIHVSELITATHLPEIISAIVPHRGRWEYLSLDLRIHYPGAFGDGRMPLLRRLSLNLSHPTALELRDSPRLRRVVLNDVAASSVILPWAQLTELFLEDAQESICLSILRQTVGLVKCLLYFQSGPRHFDYTGPKITLPSLKTLFLDIDLHGATIVGTKFISTLVVPALRRLDISEPFLGINPVDTLASFISQSGCKLQRARITGRTTKSSARVSDDAYRAAFPSIREFSFALRVKPPNNQ